MWGKKEDKGGNVADADVYLNQIRDIVKQYRRQVDQLTSMRAKTRNQKREEICVRVSHRHSPHSLQGCWLASTFPFFCP
jgi:hypothetical protein